MSVRRIVLSLGVASWLLTAHSGAAWSADTSPLQMQQAIEKAAFSGDDATFEAQKTALEAVGTPEAFYRLGVMFEKLPTKDVVRTPHPEISVGYYEKAIEAGNAKNIRDDNWLKSYAALAVLYRDGRGVAKDEARAATLFQEATKLGHAGSAYSYAQMLEKGYAGNPANIQAAKAAYLKGLGLKSGEAGLALARLYRAGSPSEAAQADEMTARALVLLRADADKGNGMAAWLGGYVYEMGNGVPKDPKEALDWYEKGAKVDAPAALLGAGRLLAQGLGGTSGQMKVVDYMRRAAMAGSVIAAMEIGESLFRGEDYYIQVHKDEALVWLKRAAIAGNAKATNRLAEWYMRQDNAVAALPYLEKSAQMGSFSAMFSLYRIYREGLAGAADMEKAKVYHAQAMALPNKKIEDTLKLVRLMLTPNEPVFDGARGKAILEEQANKGLLPAMTMLADGFEQGVFGGVDTQSALKWRGVAAARGDVTAMLALAMTYHDGVVVARDDALAKDYFKKALSSVKDTDYPVMTRIGRMYKMGGFEGKDKTQALGWFEKAAKGGDPIAQLEIGRLIVWGSVERYTAADAVKYFKAAARGGNQDALLELGKAYAGGRGVPVDHFEAVKYFARAAEMGVPEGMRQYGIALLRGRGVTQNTASGMAMLQRAASLGAFEANMDLGAYYAYGPEKNMATAVNYWKKAAEQNVADGQYLYGHALVQGIGAGKNLTEGTKWLEKAAAGANKMAELELEGLRPVDVVPVIPAADEGENVDVVDESSPAVTPQNQTPAEPSVKVAPSPQPNLQSIMGTFDDKQ